MNEAGQDAGILRPVNKSWILNLTASQLVALCILKLMQHDISHGKMSRSQ